MNFAEKNRTTIEKYHNGEITRSQCCNDLFTINARLINSKILDGLDSPAAVLFESIHKYLDKYDKSKAQFITFLYFKVREQAQDVRRKDVLVRVPQNRVKDIKLEFCEVYDSMTDNNSQRCLVGQVEKWIDTTMSRDTASSDDLLRVTILKEALNGKKRGSLEKKYGKIGDLLEKSCEFYFI
jgi:hypothetical protein